MATRKRARSEEADGGDGTDSTQVAVPAGADAAAAAAVAARRTSKRQRVAREPSGPLAAAAAAAAANTTPKTPRTIHAVASAITGAFACGGGGGKRNGDANGRLLPPSFAARLNQGGAARSQDELDKLYDVPGEEEEEDGRGETDRGAEEDGRGETDRGAEEAGEGEEEEDTLVGSASPTPDTPSKKKGTKPTPPRAKSTPKPRRDPLADLAIDGTDKLKSGFASASASATSVSRHGRIRSTPKKYLDDGGGIVGIHRTPTSSGGGAKRAGRTLQRSPTPTPTPADTTPTKGRARSVRPAGEKAKAGKEAVAKQPAASVPETPSRGRARATDQPAPAGDPPATKGVPKAGDDDDAASEVASEGASDDDDDEVCLICGKPDSEPPNEIVFCEGCDLAVHQQCYHVPAIPAGDWFCKNCVRAKAGAAAAEAATAADAAAAADAPAKGAAPTPRAPPRDLAPDIAHFEHHLARTKRVLLGRCTGRRRVALQGQDEAYDKVWQVVQQTVAAGEGNSMLVIGARGTGKTALVESVLGALAAEHAAAFHVVRLNGFVHTDDKLALREIWRQLGKEMAVDEEVVNRTNNHADTLASLLALLSHPSELGAGVPADGGTAASAEEEAQTETAAAADAAGAPAPALTSTAVVFVLDEFDLFATHARQTLLYNLFDIAQARKAPIAVLGLTTRIDVVETLEKRVKSRFSHRYVYLSLPRSLPAFWDICRRGLVVEEGEDEGEDEGEQEEGRAEFRQWWQHMIETVQDDAHFQAQLAFHFYGSKSVPAFWTACVLPLAAVSSAAPRLQLPPVHAEIGGGGGDGGGGSDGLGGVRSVGRPRRVLAGGGAGEPRDGGPPPPPLVLQPPDSKLHLLAALSELELALLIAAARLDIVLSTDTVNFAMAYDEYATLMGKQRVQASLASSGVVGTVSSGTGTGTGARSVVPGSLVVGGGARVWGRDVASRAWERLAALGLLIPAALGGGGTRGRPSAAMTSGLEGRSMWRTEVALEEIPAAPGVRLSAVLARWCKEI